MTQFILHYLIKHIDAEHSAFMAWSLTAQFKYVAGNLAKDYYSALLDYFSSPEFVKAIKKAYFKLLSEGD